MMDQYAIEAYDSLNSDSQEIVDDVIRLLLNRDKEIDELYGLLNVLNNQQLHEREKGQR